MSRSRIANQKSRRIVQRPHPGDQPEPTKGKCPIRDWIATVTATLALVALCFTFGATDVAFAKGRPGGGGNTKIRLARILFVEESGIRWDGQASCSDPVLPEDWDYWDHRDPVLTLDPVCEVFSSRIDVSGGGRVKFFTTGQRDRWLTFDFSPPFGPNEIPYDADGDQDGDGIPDGPNIDVKVYPGTDYAPSLINPDTYVDSVKTTITLDTMFKRNATRQPLDITVRLFNAAAGGWQGAHWSIHSVLDLYIVDDPSDPDVRTLQTMNPVTGQHDAALFELRHNGETVGFYEFPLTWKMRILSAP